MIYTSESIKAVKPHNTLSFSMSHAMIFIDGGELNMPVICIFAGIKESIAPLFVGG